MSVPLLWLVFKRGKKGRIVVVSADEHRGLKRRVRQAIAVEELSEAELDAISRAEPPAEAAKYDHELTEGQTTTARREAARQ